MRYVGPQWPPRTLEIINPQVAKNYRVHKNTVGQDEVPTWTEEWEEVYDIHDEVDYCDYITDGNDMDICLQNLVHIMSEDVLTAQNTWVNNNQPYLRDAGF